MARILAINPGSTSTKIAVFDGDEMLLGQTLRHAAEDLARYEHIAEQFEFRREIILSALAEAGIDPASLDGVVGRGGLIRPVCGGTYVVTEDMLADLHSGFAGEHASNLGGILAHHIAQPQSLPSYIVDPVVVDELEPVARFSGIPELPRVSIFHALNQKATARRAAAEIGKTYEEVRFIVAHLGGGITVGAHDRGRVIDVNDGLNGEGPFSPERSGGVAALKIVELLTRRGYTEAQVKKMIKGEGGLVAYCGSNNAEELSGCIDEGDDDVRLVMEAMAYQVAKEIGAMATVLRGTLEAIILTGGLAHDERVVKGITERVSFLAPVKVYPGEDEMRALAEGADRVLRGEEQALTYADGKALAGGGRDRSGTTARAGVRTPRGAGDTRDAPSGEAAQSGDRV
ncbi:MAG: butyrate kinase [Spirochaetota bacterium]